MKKVLHLITGLEKTGGAERMLRKTLPHLKSAEQGVCVLRGRGAIGQELEALGLKVFYLEMKNIFDFGVIKRYRAIIQEFSPDIQINYLIHADIFGRVFAKKFGVKKIISYIRNRHVKPLFVFLDRITLARTDYLLANSQAVLKFYRGNYGYPAIRSACIPNGVETEIDLFDFEQNKIRAEFGAGEKDFLLFTIASLEKQKDLPTLFRALKILKDRGEKGFKFLLCGRGRQKEYLENLRRELGLENEIIFLGARERKEIYQLLAIADIFILPSKHEGMSNALLEAMNFGRPCLVSDIPENAELIKSGANGLAFRAGSPEDLAEKIIYLRNHQPEAQEFGRKARQEILEKYDIKKIIKDLDLFIENYPLSKKIIWIANDRNDIYLNFFRALGEQRPELDLFLIAGDKEASSGAEKFFRWQVFPFAYRRLMNLIFIPARLIAKLKGKKADTMNLDYYRGLGALLKKENPDLVMVNLYQQPTSWQALFYCLIHHKPLLLLEEKKALGKSRLRRAVSIFELLLAAPLLFYAQKIYCYTSDCLNFGKKYFPVFNKKKIELLPASVDTRIFYNQHLRKDGEKLKIYITARIVPFKRYEDLFRALKNIKDRGQIKFVLNIRGNSSSVAGDAVFEKEFNALIDELGLRADINFVPPTAYEKQVDNFNQNDIFVLPSFNEPIGIVVPEAMACGLPVIISDTCGSKTYVQDGVNGYIFKTFDFLALAEKIVLLADKKRREEFGFAAEKTIKEKFDSRIIARDFFEKIKNLL